MYITETTRKQLDVEHMFRVLSSRRIGIKIMCEKDYYLRILSRLIKEYRFELLSTYMGYQIILDGASAFKRIEYKTGFVITRKDMFNRIRELNKNTDIEIEL